MIFVCKIDFFRNSAIWHFGARPRDREVCEESIAIAMDDEQNSRGRRSQPEMPLAEFRKKSIDILEITPTRLTVARGMGDDLVRIVHLGQPPPNMPLLSSWFFAGFTSQAFWFLLESITARRLTAIRTVL